MLGQYYLEKNNLREAERFALQAMDVWNALVNPSHIKIGESNYQLAEIYNKGGNLTEALRLYKLTRNVLEHKFETTRSNEYGELLIKISRLEMKLSQYKEGI